VLELITDRKLRCAIQISGRTSTTARWKRRAPDFFPQHQGRVSPERLRRFFTKSDGGYRINKNIRQMCIFARQNMINDPRSRIWI